MLILTFLITIIKKQFTPYKLNCTIKLLWLLKKILFSLLTKLSKVSLTMNLPF